jgi:Cu2+-exporting ATPase
MLFFDVLIMGGVAYAGAKAFGRHQGNKNEVWLNEAHKLESPSTQARLSSVDQNVGQRFVVTSVSLGLSMSGATLGYGALSLASVPLNLYAIIPVLDDAFEQLMDRGQLKFGFFISTVTLGAMALEYYFVASLVDWSYHFIALLNQVTAKLNKKLLGELEHYYRQALYQFLNTRPTSVWVKFNEVELNIPFAELNVGDILILDEYSVVPVDGRIVEGNALVDRYILTGERQPIEIKTGDMVFTSTIILSGRVLIEVSRK